MGNSISRRVPPDNNPGFARRNQHRSVQLKGGDRRAAGRGLADDTVTAKRPLKMFPPRLSAWIEEPRDAAGSSRVFDEVGNVMSSLL